MYNWSRNIAKILNWTFCLIHNGENLKQISMAARQQIVRRNSFDVSQQLENIIFDVKIVLLPRILYNRGLLTRCN